jgi:two-component system response regulator HydG
VNSLGIKGGSFTGAIQDKTGHFEAANGGTYFLDEIGNLSYGLQVQLLRLCRNEKIKPIGSNHGE